MEGLPFIYFLDKRGRDYLAEKWDVDPKKIDWKPSYNNVQSQHLDHVLGINDVRIAVTQALEILGYTLEAWLDDTTIKKQSAYDAVTLQSSHGRKYAAKVIPDSYFRLNDGVNRYHFLLELDRSTESGPRFGRKIRAYLEWEAGRILPQTLQHADGHACVGGYDNREAARQSDSGHRGCWWRPEFLVYDDG